MTIGVRGYLYARVCGELSHRTGTVWAKLFALADYGSHALEEWSIHIRTCLNHFDSTWRMTLNVRFESVKLSVSARLVRIHRPGPGMIKLANGQLLSNTHTPTKLLWREATTGCERMPSQLNFGAMSLARVTHVYVWKTELTEKPPWHHVNHASVRYPIDRMPDRKSGFSRSLVKRFLRRLEPSGFAQNGHRTTDTVSERLSFDWYGK